MARKWGKDLTRFVTAVLTIPLCALALATQASAAPADRALPMRFELRQETSSETCTRDCRRWISAVGAINAETPKEFLRFSEGRDLRNAVIVLDSDGGSVLGAIALGREIRRLGLATTVGRLVEGSTPGGDPRTALNSRADCESMCAFVLLAGVQRNVPMGARVMVHQIWLGDRREDPTAVNYSAEDLALVQRDIGRLTRYTADMGGPMELIEMALRIPPWEPMRSLSREDLRRMKLDTETEEPRPAVTIAATPISATSAFNSGMRGVALSEPAWTLADHSGVATLMRRHALTIEGDEIGSFDVLVACGLGDTYRVTYVERRKLADVARVEPVASVSVRTGRTTVSLPVVSSARRGANGELETLASGDVPIAVIDAFAGNGPHSMMVTTRSSDTTTAVRLGNTGVRRNLTQLAAACQKAGGVRAELRIDKPEQRAASPGEKTGGVAIRQ